MDGAPAARPGARIAALLLALAALFALGRYAGVHVERFASWVEGLGFWGPAAFVLGYAVAVVALVPASLLTLAAGAIFGIPRGVACVLAAATLGACAAFLVARHLARSAVEAMVERRPKLAAIDRAVERDGLRIAFLLRLTPVVPFNLLNYALGLTRLSLRDYAIACSGMLPGTLLYVYTGKLARDVTSLASDAALTRGWLYYGVLLLGLVATLAVTLVVTRSARRALAEATDAPRSAPTQPTDPARKQP
ncbi:MAG TPA: TVP38/TMEM64 family protein [Myxococcota bacterium]|nr:TVP38/TMEM64 family protein [Myxococcota bacterium]